MTAWSFKEYFFREYCYIIFYYSKNRIKSLLDLFCQKQQSQEILEILNCELKKALNFIDVKLESETVAMNYIVYYK